MQVVLAVANRDVRLALQIYLAEEPGVGVAGIATDAAGARALMRSSKPDLLLMAWDLPGCAPDILVAEARRAQPPAQVVVLCRDEQERAVAVAAGARDGITPWDPPGRLAQVIAAARAAVRAAQTG